MIRFLSIFASLALVFAPPGAAVRLGADVSHPIATVSITVQIVAGSGTVSSEPAGIDCGQTCTFQFVLGSHVTLTAIPGTGGSVHEWGGACSGSTTTCSLTPLAPTNVMVSFDPVRLTVTAQGSGGWVTSSGVDSPDGIDCGVGSTCTGSFAIGTKVTLFAIRTEDGALDSWGNCPFASSVLCTVTMTGDISVVASFSRVALQVPVTIETDVDFSPAGNGAGDIAITPPGAAQCSAHCVRRYPVGVKLHLTASPTGNSTFGGWTGGCGGASGATCTVGVVPGLAIGALFQPAPAPAPPPPPPPPAPPPPPNDGGQKTTPPATPIARQAHVLVVHAGNRRTFALLIDVSRDALARISIRANGAPTLRKDAALTTGVNRVRVAVPARRPAGRQRVTILLRDAQGRTQTINAAVRLA